MLEVKQINELDKQIKSINHQTTPEGVIDTLNTIATVIDNKRNYSKDNLIAELPEYDIKIRTDLMHQKVSELRLMSKLIVEDNLPLPEQTCQRLYDSIKDDIQYIMTSIIKLLTKNNVPLVEFEVEFPTGELIITDWVRDVDNVLDQFESNADINQDSGIIQQILSFAKGNICHTFVGNTCPSVYLSSDTLTVETADYNEELDDYTPSIEGAKEIDSICTDLWWATIIDKQTLLDLYNKKTVNTGNKSFDDTCDTKIKPGVYKCTYYGRSHAAHEQVYTKMEWIRDI